MSFCLFRWPGSTWWDRCRGGGEVSNLPGCAACRRACDAWQLLPCLLPQMPPHMGWGDVWILVALCHNAFWLCVSWVNQYVLLMCLLYLHWYYRCLFPARWTEGLSQMFTDGMGTSAVCRFVWILLLFLSLWLNMCIRIQHWKFQQALLNKIHLCKVQVPWLNPFLFLHCLVDQHFGAPWTHWTVCIVS